ncbi:MAG: hypothetical protein D8M59_13210 [Planctomycetes bacterium]|nr:hypothetical protein [Planctomycetota bacterium]NOG54961.1 hypothetical protein [Planctomycetota bacterium]
MPNLETEPAPSGTIAVPPEEALPVDQPTSGHQGSEPSAPEGTDGRITAAEFESWDATGSIEIDRYCVHCGYNLRMQPVRTEPRTQLLSVRCPECSRFMSAHESITTLSLWARRLAPLAFSLWVCAVLFAYFMMSLGSGGLVAASLDEFTNYGMSRIVTNQGVTYMTSSGGPRTVASDPPAYFLVVGLSVAAEAALGFAIAMLATVVFPHWRRWGYYIWVCLPACVGVGLLSWMWCYDIAPHLSRWGLTYILNYEAVFLLFGLLGCFWSRPLARLMARIFLTARLRGVFGYLWAADGLEAPSTRPSMK